jgi:ADP-ribose pyrophosphatase YjhB (NUDIX family)
MLGANIAIIDDGRILLTKREDLEIWCLPGGHVDAGESIAETAIREAREETGLEIQLTRLVGIYSEPNWGGEGIHIVLFTACPTSGQLQPQVGEVIDLRYFDPRELPDPLMWWHHQRIVDAVENVSGVVWTQYAWPFEKGMTRQELYRLRDRSGLARWEFYLRYFEQPSERAEKLEVGNEAYERTSTAAPG